MLFDGKKYMYELVNNPVLNLGSSKISSRKVGNIQRYIVMLK